ncbi:MAG: hypothetical protein GY755_09530 [Chloroflexi bacterium]|nr:hypothetical protein [Chloroflexota bacterium]
MILHTPTKVIKDGQVSISARFELESHLPYLPRELWYRFPEKYAKYISLRADAFAATALLMAMYTGENLEIRGIISPKLAYNLFEYRNIYHTWDPDFFKKVDIQYDHLEKPPEFKKNPAVATAFSGGVDSFYTLWAHRPENQPIPDAQVTHGLFVHGLDLRLDDEKNYRAAAEPYSQLFDKLDLELIQAATNTYQFSEFRINWTMFFGTPLIGAALLLAPWMRRFYMPSGMPSYLNLFPQGSSPLIDFLLSTETTEIVHHAASISRYDKVATLTTWPVSNHKPRVCSDKTRMSGLNNCSACHKCYRTMILLEQLDASSNYNNFSKKLTPSDYFRWGALTHLNLEIAIAARNRSFQNSRIVMAFWMQIAILLRIFSKFLIESVKKFISKEKLYRLKRIVFKPEIDIKARKK